MTSSAGISTTPVTTYHEKMIGKTLYRVTSVYKGEIDLKQALEGLTVSKALRAAESGTAAEHICHG